VVVKLLFTVVNCQVIKLLKTIG